MIRVPEDKSVTVLINYQMFNDSGLFVHEDELWTRINEEQFNRIQSSYDSGKFLKMSDDESLRDLTINLDTEVRKAKWQVFSFDFPTDIIRGFSFEEETKLQWDAEAFNELLDSISFKFTPEEEAEMDAIAEEAYNEGLRSEKIGGKVDDLIAWIRDKGFDTGDRYYSLTDDSNKRIVTFDIAWPFGIYGLQRGFTQPLVLRIDANTELVETAKELGFKCFTSIAELKSYIEKNHWRR